MNINDIIFKIEQTLDIAFPVIVLFLSVFHFTGTIIIIEEAQPIIYGVLAAVAAIIKIWAITLRVLRS